MSRHAMKEFLVAGCVGIAVFGTSPLAARDLPGQSFHVTAENLPAPYSEDSVANSSQTVPRPAGTAPMVPDGFEIALFADRLAHPRNMVVDAKGTVFLAESRAGKITWLRDGDGDGRAEERFTFVDGFDRPHGLALRDGWLYFADRRAVWRIALPDNPQQGQKPERLTGAGALGPASGHWTRNIAFSQDGAKLFAAIGSRGNIAEEPLPRASIQVFPVLPDGTLEAPRTWASGLRNPVGTAINPSSGVLFTVVNERDGMGDRLVPDYFTEVREGGFYGWPYSYLGGHPQPDYADRRPDLVEKAIAPDVLFQSHSAPIGMIFARGGEFPDSWQDDALVALRGSWNAARPTGYKVVRVLFEGGAPTGRYENLVTGFRLDDPDEGKPGPAIVWGRPTGLALMPDGSLLISDDTGKTIWRMSRRP